MTRPWMPKEAVRSLKRLGFTPNRVDEAVLNTQKARLESAGWLCGKWTETKRERGFYIASSIRLRRAGWSPKKSGPTFVRLTITQIGTAGGDSDIFTVEFTLGTTGLPPIQDTFHAERRSDLDLPRLIRVGMDRVHRRLAYGSHHIEDALHSLRSEHDHG